MRNWFQWLLTERRARRERRDSHARPHGSTHAERLRARKLQHKADRHNAGGPNPLGPIDPDREFITRYGDPFD
jgi:hypothetical protein